MYNTKAQNFTDQATSTVKLKQKYLLQMRNIRKSFSDVEVLRGVSFDLRPAEVHVLAGENGAGKSTLIKILAGVHTDYKGEILVDSAPVRFRSVHEAAEKGISTIHQELSLVGSLSVAENIFLGREASVLGWLDKDLMTQEVRKLLEKLNLDLDVSKAVEDYPLSIQQMIEICKALAFDCRIIVMDEPTSALTEPEVEKLFGVIKRLKDRGCGIIYISHKMEEIYRIADRITVLRDGQYVGTAKLSELPSTKLVQWMVGRQLDQQFPRHTTNLGRVRFEVRNFSVPDPSGRPIFMVDNISFAVRAGEIVGIAGLHGSGNSHFLNGLFGTYGRAIHGDVTVDGERFTPGLPTDAIKCGISLLTNDRKQTGLMMQMSIIENVTVASLQKFSPKWWLRPKQEYTAVSAQAQSLKLKCTGLSQTVDSLSGGNQQKVVIAKWIEIQPKIMLLDEPTRGVDVVAKHEIYELMNEWTAKGISIVLITSEMPELLAMSDRIIVMHRGKITAEFSRKEATQEKVLKAAMGEVDGGRIVT